MVFSLIWKESALLKRILKKKNQLKYFTYLKWEFLKFFSDPMLNLSLKLLTTLMFSRFSFLGLASTVQRPRDGYNTFTDGSTTQPPFNSFLNPKWNEPYFDNNVPNNVTALVGKSAYLSCRVRNLGNKTVCKQSDDIDFKSMHVFVL